MNEDFGTVPREVVDPLGLGEELGADTKAVILLGSDIENEHDGSKFVVDSKNICTYEFKDNVKDFLIIPAYAGEEYEAISDDNYEPRGND